MQEVSIHPHHPPWVQLVAAVYVSSGGGGGGEEEGRRRKRRKRKRRRRRKKRRKSSLSPSLPLSVSVSVSVSVCLCLCLSPSLPPSPHLIVPCFPVPNFNRHLRDELVTYTCCPSKATDRGPLVSFPFCTSPSSYPQHRMCASAVRGAGLSCVACSWSSLHRIPGTRRWRSWYVDLRLCNM